MKRSVLLLTCLVGLSSAAPFANAATDIRFWHHKHKDSDKSTAASDSTEVPKPKSKKNVLHRTKPSREKAARSEAAFGMTGPKSVGLRHPEPGPAGFGAK